MGSTRAAIVRFNHPQAPGISSRRLSRLKDGGQSNERGGGVYRESSDGSEATHITTVDDPGPPHLADG